MSENTPLRSSHKKCKFGESDDRLENSDFVLFHQKDPFGEIYERKSTCRKV